MGYPLGIDLGTTYCAVACLNADGDVEILRNAEGTNTTPSVVFFDDGEILVGMDAKNAAVSAPDRVAQFVKRSIGDPNAGWELDGRTYDPVDLSALILAKLKRDSEAALGEPVAEAVITVPAYFAEAQRSNTVAAGRKAGLQVLAIINEPTAAAIDYGLGRVREEQLVLVYDLGGGTFDVTLLMVTPATEPGGASDFRVLATDGNARLGGKDWDDRIAGIAAKAFEQEHDIDPSDEPADYQDLLRATEEAKQKLSSMQRVNLTCQCGGKRLAVTLTRDRFEETCEDLLNMTRSTVRSVLAQAGVEAGKVKTVLMVGGSTRMPMVARMLKEEFGKAPQAAPNPDETVARGAALYAATLAVGRTPPVPGGATAPMGLLGSVTIRDVTSHTLGTLAKREGEYVVSAIIRKNATIPARETREDYTTGRENQDELIVPVLQGESEEPAYCELIACWSFSGIPPRPAGQSPLRVVFGYDANGIVEVEAEDVLTGTKLVKSAKPVSGIEELLNPPEPPTPPLWMVLCIDISGSMSGLPLDQAKRGAKDFIKTFLSDKEAEAEEKGGPAGDGWVEADPGLSAGRRGPALPGGTGSRPALQGASPDCRIGIVEFESRAKTVSRAVADRKALLKAVDQLQTRGGTDIADGLRKAHGQVLNKAPSGARREIVLLTDGGSAADPAIRAADAAKRDGIFIRTLACGTGADKGLLAKIASPGEGNQFETDASHLHSAFADVAVEISKGLQGG